MIKDKRSGNIILICLVIISIVIVSTVESFRNVDISKYTIRSEKIPEQFNDFKIVQISDFHSKGYKDTTDIIINKIKKIDPDIVVMTGDMIDWEINDITELEKVINQISSEFTTYYVDGNHEHLAEILKTDEYNEFMKYLKSSEVIVLKNEKKEIEKEGQVINIYGIDMPLDQATGLYVSEEDLEDNYLENRINLVESDKFNILLAHNPFFIEKYSSWGADLVLSGHVHGGIIRMPIVGIGIASPEGGYFPKYDGGKYNIDGSIMIVNRGIGTSSKEYRIFNNPEISVITLKKK